MSTDRASILAAFDVTEDDLATLDPDVIAAEDAARAEREHYRDVVRVERVAAVETEINATLPDGLTVKFWP